MDRRGAIDYFRSFRPGLWSTLKRNYDDSFLRRTSFPNFFICCWSFFSFLTFVIISKYFSAKSPLKVKPNAVLAKYMKRNFNGFCSVLRFLEERRLLEAMMRLEWINHLDNVFNEDGYLMIPESLYGMSSRDHFNFCNFLHEHRILDYNNDDYYRDDLENDSNIFFG